MQGTSTPDSSTPSFNSGIVFDRFMVDEFLVKKFIGVENFLVEKSLIQKFMIQKPGVEAWDLKSQRLKCLATHFQKCFCTMCNSTIVFSTNIAWIQLSIICGYRYYILARSFWSLETITEYGSKIIWTCQWKWWGLVSWSLFIKGGSKVSFTVCSTKTQ